MPKNTLYVTGFTKESKAADLAPDFEKYVICSRHSATYF